MKSVRELKQKKISFSLNKHSGDAYKASEASRELGHEADPTLRFASGGVSSIT